MKKRLQTPSEENNRCWTDGREDTEEMRDTLKESRELRRVVRMRISSSRRTCPADWRCVDAESEENDAQPDGKPRLTRRGDFAKAVCETKITSCETRDLEKA
jgi:hypothetical protein